jgi:signal peptidase I
MSDRPGGPGEPLPFDEVDEGGPSRPEDAAADPWQPTAPPPSGSTSWGSPGGVRPGPAREPEHPRDQRRGRTRQSTGAGSFLRELPVLLLVAFLLAFVLRTFVLQVFFIPSSSMEETLQIDDRMVVEKITYRFREPRRGEIVVFEGDSFAAVDADAGLGPRVVRGVGQFLGVVPANARDFVKRVIGLPGDEVLIEGGQVFVNGTALDEPYVVHDDLSDYGPVTVPDDALFFLGDNRPNSSDSRRSLGFVQRDHVVGRSVLIIWPLDHTGRLTGTVHEVADPTLR